MIISIDLDYFYPNNNSVWDYVLEDSFNEQSIETDLNIVNQIKYLIKNKKLVLLNKHNELLKFIKSNDIVVNFDFHHDIFYSKEDKKLIDYFDYMDEDFKESCWVGYAIKYLNIDYYWIGHSNSDNDINYKNELTFELNSDIIYIIKSENYINNKQFNYIWRLLNE